MILVPNRRRNPRKPPVATELSQQFVEPLISSGPGQQVIAVQGLLHQKRLSIKGLGRLRGFGCRQVRKKSGRHALDGDQHIVDRSAVLCLDWIDQDAPTGQHLN